MSLPRIHVLAGALVARDGRVLVAQRPPGKHLAGGWEFPGGKRDAGESRIDALARELAEELGVRLEAARPLIRFTHEYPDRIVDLDVWRVDRWQGDPRGLDGQAIAWCAIGDLDRQGLLPADRPIVTALDLPPMVAITGGAETQANEASSGHEPVDRSLADALAGRAETLVAAGAGVVQLRIPVLDPGRLSEVAREVAPRCRAAGGRLVVNGLDSRLLDLLSAGLIDGLHIPARFLETLAGMDRPAGLIGASCHSPRELARAAAAGADYVFLSPVRPTRSHPGAEPLGWEQFAAWVAPVRMPVYALGGLGPRDLKAAWDAGAQGVAGIRGFGSSRSR